MTSQVRSLLAHLGSNPNRQSTEGVIWVSALMVPFTLGWVALMGYAMGDPGRAPFVDRDTLEMGFFVQTRFVIPVWIALLLAGLFARKRAPESRVLVYATILHYSLSTGFFSYCLGYYTNLWGALSLFGAVTLGLLLFEARVVRTFVYFFAALILATTVAEQAGLLPYAPALATAPYEGGHLSRTFLLLEGLPALTILFILAFVFVGAVELARDREERLARATKLIRRYVAAQLAERILSGEHLETTLPERRKLTIFFSDVVGFTQAADRMEPEDLSLILNEYLAEMAAIADAYGATVNQFVGDGIMSFFGAPDSTNDRDHALRAVRMALAMQRRMVDLRAKWYEGGIQTPFHIRIGINTGVSSVGDFGSEGRTTYSAIGNQTNLAARIQDRCTPGGVLISHPTWGLVKDEIPCKEHGEIEVKGIHYPVRVYEVLDLAPEA